MAVEADAGLELTSVLTGGRGFLWMKEGAGIAGSGEAAAVDPGTGPGRFQRAEESLWEAFSRAKFSDVPPVAFGSFTFDPERAGSALVLPEVVLRREPGEPTVVTGDEGVDALVDGALQRTGDAAADAGHDFDIRYAGSTISEVAWLDAVAAAAETIRGGALEKVVLARDVLIWSKEELDLGVLVRRLGRRFPQCFTFAFDGLVGATPELLIRRTGRNVESIVLAGSARRGVSQAEDESIGRALLSSPKDLSEHRPAVRSVADVLRLLCSEIDVPLEPSLLRLPNVQHLATHIRGELKEPVTALGLAGRLHPSAAVCGLPRSDAMNLISSSEGMDRARYSGPVGWVDARGDGEWGIALRCAEIQGKRGRLFAGNGIVGDSIPEDELEETRLKLRAMISALG